MPVHWRFFSKPKLFETLRAPGIDLLAAFAEMRRAYPEVPDIRLG